MILVTGSTGFIGSHVLKHLHKMQLPCVGLDVREPDRQVARGDFIKGDIEDVSCVRKLIVDYQPSVVLNLAARTDIDRNAQVTGYSQNYNGLRVILDCLQESHGSARVIHVSSQLVNTIGHFPKKPTEYDPPNAYGLSKAMSEDVLWSHDSIRGGVTIGCVVRPTTIWGPQMNPEYLQFFRLLKKGYYVHVTKANKFKSYGYVGNTVAQLLALATCDGDEIANSTLYACDYTPIELYEWVNQLSLCLSGSSVRRMPEVLSRTAAFAGDLLQAVGVKAPLDSYRLNNMLTEYVVSHKTIKPHLPKLPYSFQDGIEETCLWLEKVLD